ncbi:diacylglycerol kinase [Aurantivibrio plasticivorans]
MSAVTNEIIRLKNATRFSMQGLVKTWHSEAAFRFEVVLAVILIPLAVALPLVVLEKLFLVATVVLVLVVELLNSAVEAAVDRIGSEHHPLSGQAKDMGSAAVFICLLFTVFSWLVILANRFLA